MQENDTSVKGSVPAPKPTKYRLACDSCQQSKLKCDQSRPKCSRCAKRNIPCIYSPAKRAGRPRTRNNSKTSSSVDTSTSAGLKAYPTPIAEQSRTDSTSGWLSPSMLSASDRCSSSSSCSNCSNPSTFSNMTQTIQMPSCDELEFSLYQQPDDDFLQGLPDYTTSPEFHIAPELLNTGYFGSSWEKQQQQQVYEQHPPTSTDMLFDVELPCYTPEEHQQLQRPEHRPQENTNANNFEGCSNPSPPIQQLQPHTQFSQSSDYASPSTRSCNCTVELLDHLSKPSSAPSSPSLASISAALSTSRTLISSCCSAMACPNACSARPSTALVICEAIDRALASLKLTSLSPSSSNSDNSNDTMLSLADEEHEPLRIGNVPISGVDRTAVLRVLLVKRVLEVQGVLERLRDSLVSGSVDVAVKTLCAGLVKEVSEKVSKLHIQ